MVDVFRQTVAVKNYYQIAMRFSRFGFIPVVMGNLGDGQDDLRHRGRSNRGLESKYERFFRDARDTPF